jgi:anti-sigma factor RsiW
VNCRETLPLLSLFVDGELDSRQMREVALHSTRCAACEQELRGIERVQDMVVECVNSAVDDMGVVDIWPSIAARIETVRQPWTARMRDWWESGETRWLLRAPLYAAAAAALALLAVRWLPDAGAKQQTARVSVDNSVIFDSVGSDAPSLALLNEPETNTMVLWVTDEGTAGAEDLGGPP